MRALINAFIVHVTLNVLVFLKGWYTFDDKKWARIILIVIFGTELSVYSIGLIFYHSTPNAITQFIRVMGTSWMLFLLYTGGLWLIIDLTYIITRRIQRRSWHFKDHPQSYKIITYLVSVLVVSGVMVQGRYRFLHPIVQEVHLSVQKQAGRTDSLSVAVIGDLHLGWMINRKQTRRFVDLIMEQKPDLILFVGDILDAQIEPILAEKMDEELSRLSAPLGVYSCTGNHDYRYEAEDKIKLLNDAGITMLRDSAVLIDSSFYVVGREDKIITNRLSTKNLFSSQGIDLSKLVIVLNHTPDNLDEEVEAGADIALYGHTHHGQAFPGNIATESIFEVAHGYKKKENTHIYVTSGIGLVGPQYRIGTVSEIVMLKIKFKQ